MCFPTTSTNILSRPGVPAMPNRCASTLQACRKTQWKPTFYVLLFFLFCLPIFPAHLLFCCRVLAGFRVGDPFRLMNCAFILFGYASFQRHFCFAFPSTPHTSCRSGTSSSHGFLFTQSSMCSRDCGVGLNSCFWRRYANNIFIQERPPNRLGGTNLSFCRVSIMHPNERPVTSDMTTLSPRLLNFKDVKEEFLDPQLSEKRLLALGANCTHKRLRRVYTEWPTQICPSTSTDRHFILNWRPKSRRERPLAGLSKPL